MSFGVDLNGSIFQVQNANFTVFVWKKVAIIQGSEGCGDADTTLPYEPVATPIKSRPPLKCVSMTF